MKNTLSFCLILIGFSLQAQIEVTKDNDFSKLLNSYPEDFALPLWKWSQCPQRWVNVLTHNQYYLQMSGFPNDRFAYVPRDSACSSQMSADHSFLCESTTRNEVRAFSITSALVIQKSHHKSVPVSPC